MASQNFNVVVLAGDRGLEDPVVKHAQVTNKAEISLGGVMQLERVLMALFLAGSINEIFVVGPNKQQSSIEIENVLAKYNATSIPVAAGPSASAMRGLEASKVYPTLVVTCDLPLITAEHIDAYCLQISNIKADFIIGAVDYELISERFPELRKTIYGFSNESICFANIFAVMSEKGIRAVDFWREMEDLRKSPLQIISKLGWGNILSYKLGRLQLARVATVLSKRVEARVSIENIPCVALAVDVDSVHDFEVMSAHLQ